MGTDQGNARTVGFLSRTWVRSWTGGAGNWGIGGEQAPAREGGCWALGLTAPWVHLSPLLLMARLCHPHPHPPPGRSSPRLASCGGELRGLKIEDNKCIHLVHTKCGGRRFPRNDGIPVGTGAVSQAESHRPRSHCSPRPRRGCLPRVTQCGPQSSWGCLSPEVALNCDDS